MSARLERRPGSDDPEPDFTRLPDLASRLLGGAVVWANDELFAERENLIKPEEPSYPICAGRRGPDADRRAP